MSSISSTKVYAEVANAYWAAFDKFLASNLEDNDGLTVMNSNKPFDDEISMNFFLLNFVQKKEIGKKHCFVLNEDGRLCFGYIRTLAADKINMTEKEQYQNLLQSFGGSNAKAQKYFQNIHDQVCLRIKENVEQFLNYASPDPMQEAMIRIFGKKNVLSNVGKYFKWICLLHIGRFLGTEHYPKSGSMKLGAELHIYRCICSSIYEGMTSESSSLTYDAFVALNKKDDEDDVGHNHHSYKDIDVAMLEVDAGGEENDEVLTGDGVDVDKATMTGSTIPPRIARALKLFVLREWYNYCEQYHCTNESKFLGICLTTAVEQYNRHASGYGLSPMKDISSEVKLFIRTNWLGSLISGGKFVDANQKIIIAPSDSPIIDWNPTILGVNDRRADWANYYSYHIASCKSSSLVSSTTSAATALLKRPISSISSAVAANEEDNLKDGDGDLHISKQVKKFSSLLSKVSPILSSAPNSDAPAKKTAEGLIDQIFSKLAKLEDDRVKSESSINKRLDQLFEMLQKFNTEKN